MNASVYSSALLNEANNLVEIGQAKQSDSPAATLTFRVLSDQREKKPFGDFRAKNRTPRSVLLTAVSMPTRFWRKRGYRHGNVSYYCD
ncbi:hypothetical protein OK016_04930 [Vibrio chagasii]|nr:hypothetical protein [Vibrio chagasii]